MSLFGNNKFSDMWTLREFCVAHPGVSEDVSASLSGLEQKGEMLVVYVLSFLANYMNY